MSEDTQECVTCDYDGVALNTHYKNYPDHKPDEWPECPQCGKQKGSMGHHWKLSASCSFPSISEHLHEIATGMIMGDAWVIHNANPIICSEMINKRFLEWVDSEFGILSTGVEKLCDAEEAAKQKRDSGWDVNANKESYSDMYVWRTRANPEFTRYSNWYSSGSKVFPESIDLTPMVLKAWYVCDGTRKKSGSDTARDTISINCSNEVGNNEKISSYFAAAGIPEPNNFSERERKSGGINFKAYWNVNESDELWTYMGDPVPGFEHKWPEQHR